MASPQSKQLKPFLLTAQQVLKGLEIPHSLHYFNSMRDLQPHQHYKTIAYKNAFPQTKSQTLFFLYKMDFYYKILNYNDVVKMEAFLNKHGLNGIYRYTKSKTCCRILNNDVVKIALIKEFSIKTNNLIYNRLLTLNEILN